MGDLFYDLVLGLRLGLGFGGGRFSVTAGDGRFGEIEAGDLETVEEEAGATGVDVIGGDALEDLADGQLNAGTIVGIGKREIEGGAAVSACARGFDGLAIGVMVVAEGFSAEAWAAATAAVGEDVAALVAFGCFGFGRVHLVSPLVLFCAKSSED